MRFKNDLLASLFMVLVVAACAMENELPTAAESQPTLSTSSIEVDGPGTYALPGDCGNFVYTIDNYITFYQSQCTTQYSAFWESGGTHYEYNSWAESGSATGHQFCGDRGLSQPGAVFSCVDHSSEEFWCDVDPECDGDHNP